ncbi:MAG: hypothetical protein GY846_10350 [Deltaproteobacteria bacterium]|nr:hypothetical protein [Deltaproteobacteria bacterium]
MTILNINFQGNFNFKLCHNKRIWFAGVLISLLLAFGSSHVAAQAPEGNPPGLFTALPLKEASGLGTVNESLVIRLRPCQINFEMLALDRKDKPERLSLNLFDDKTFTVLLDRIETGCGLGHAWIGHLEGIEDSEVTLVFKDGRLSGTIIFPGGHFEVRHVENAVHEIREMALDFMSETLRAVACTDLFSQESQSITLVNQERAANSLHLLSCDQRLVNSSRGHSTYMSTQTGYCSHTGAGGSSPSERMTDAGYNWNFAAENVACGFSTAQAAHNAWMNSPGHRDNILNATPCDIGVGYFYDAGSTYGYYWTQNFGRLSGVSVCPVAPVCPDCSDPELILENVTFPAGSTCTCVTAISITLGVGVLIESGATVTFQSPIVTIQDGFHAEDGSTVTIRQ